MQSRPRNLTGKRIPYLDILRSIAVISITVSHAVNRSFAVYSKQYDEYRSIPFLLTVIKAVIFAFSRIGVPLFVMISGTLLMPRDYTGGIREGSVSRFLKHNWLRLFVTTEIWLAIMFWYIQIIPGSDLYTRGISYTLVRFVMTLLFLNPVTLGSMWYMEMILCVYLLIPILSNAVRRIDYKYFLIPAAIVIFCSYILPDLNGVVKAFGFETSLETKLESANVFSMYVVYLLLGYYVGRGILSKARTGVLWLVIIVTSVCFCAFQIWFYSKEFNFVVGKDYHSFFPMIIAVATFELARRYRAGSARRLERIATKLSVISFGIYFVHICIMEGLNLVIWHFCPGLRLLWKFIVLEGVSFFGAVLIVNLCSRNRWMRRYLFNIKQ